MKTVFGDRIAPTLVSCALFSKRGLWEFGNRRLHLHSAVGLPAERNAKMKLKIRYDEAYQVLDLDEQATEQLWVSLDLDGGEALSQEEREKRIQEAFDAKYNRPEYNSWRKLNRHRGESKAKPGKDETEDDVDTSEPLMSEVADDRIFRQDELSRRSGNSMKPSANGSAVFWRTSPSGRKRSSRYIWTLCRQRITRFLSVLTPPRLRTGCAAQKKS